MTAKFVNIAQKHCKFCGRIILTRELMRTGDNGRYNYYHCGCYKIASKYFPKPKRAEQRKPHFWQNVKFFSLVAVFFYAVAIPLLHH